MPHSRLAAAGAVIAAGAACAVPSVTPVRATAASGAQVACLPADSLDVVYRARPRNCVFLLRNGERITANMLAVYGLRWQHWGAGRAVGRGTWRGNMNSHGKVTVVLSQRSTCLGHRRYGRATFRYPDGTHPSMLLDTCTDDLD